MSGQRSSVPSEALALQFRVFAMVWVTAGWFHIWNQVPWPAAVWWRPSAYQMVMETVMVGAAVAVFATGGRALPFLVFLVAEVLHASADVPRVANHWYITWMVGLAMLGSGAVVWQRTRGLAEGAWLNHFAPAARWLIVICYSFSALSKFNTSFLDPEQSCASTTWVHISEEFIALPTGAAFLWLAIGAAVLTEVSVPVLLLTRFRHLGVLLGMLFHYLISVPPQLHVPDFAMMLFALWFLFLPPNVAVRMRDLAAARLGPLARSATARAALVAPIAAIPLACYAIGSQAETLMNGLAFGRVLVFGLMGAAWTVWVFLTLRNEEEQVEPLDAPLAVRHPWHIALLTLAVVTGLSAYLGLRTTTNYTMFSNIKTETGTSNHLFMPQVYLSAYQRDLVTVEASNIRRLNHIVSRGLLLPFWELRFQYQRALDEGQADAAITYRRGDQVVEVHGPADDPALMAPIGFVERRLLSFRAVDPGDVSTCQW